MNTTERLESIRKQMGACIQCGTCTASCPNAFGMGEPPRRMWLLLIRGEIQEIFHSRSFSLCSSCYMCRLRCPRGLPLTECIGELKRVAAAEHVPACKKSSLFYKAFLESVRRHGRVNELEFMTRYFLTLKNPVVPLTFTPLGLTLLRKGKVSMPPLKKRAEVLGSLYDRVACLEESP